MDGQISGYYRQICCNICSPRGKFTQALRKELLNEVVGEFERLAPKAIERLETGFVDAMAVMLL